MALKSEITSGFWTGIGFALAVLLWGVGQMLMNRGRG